MTNTYPWRNFSLPHLTSPIAGNPFFIPLAPNPPKVRGRRGFDGAKTPFSLDKGNAEALVMQEGDQVWSVKGGTGYEGWNSSGPMKDSSYNPDQRTASKGAACKGYHITRASAWIAADAPSFVPAPATPPPPQNDMFPFVSPQSPLFPADIALPPNQNNGFMPPAAMSNGVTREMGLIGIAAKQPNPR